MSFSEELKGPQPHAKWDYELAELSDAVYKESGRLPDGKWRELQNDEIPPRVLFADGTHSRGTALTDESCGFRARIYAHTDGQGKERMVVAFRGTVPEEGKRRALKNNVGQGLGWIGPQYQNAIALGKAASKEWKGDVVFTGHSMGGGLAGVAAAASLHGNAAVTFNAAKAHRNSIDKAGEDIVGFNRKEFRQEAAQGGVRTYQATGDFLTDKLDFMMPGKHLGCAIKLDHYDISPNISNMMQLHSIQKVASSMAANLEMRFADSESLDPVLTSLARDKSIDSQDSALRRGAMKDFEARLQHDPRGHDRQHFAAVAHSAAHGLRAKMPGQGSDRTKALGMSESIGSYEVPDRIRELVTQFAREALESRSGDRSTDTRPSSASQRGQSRHSLGLPPGEGSSLRVETRMTSQSTDVQYTSPVSAWPDSLSAGMSGGFSASGQSSRQVSQSMERRGDSGWDHVYQHRESHTQSDTSRASSIKSTGSGDSHLESELRDIMEQLRREQAAQLRDASRATDRPSSAFGQESDRTGLVPRRTKSSSPKRGPSV